MYKQNLGVIVGQSESVVESSEQTRGTKIPHPGITCQSQSLFQHSSRYFYSDLLLYSHKGVTWEY